MRTTIIWSSEAIDALEEICEFLAQRSATRAARFEDDVVEAVELVAMFPRLGVEVPEYRNPRVRQVFVDDYRILYPLHADGATIETIVHGSVKLD